MLFDNQQEKLHAQLNEKVRSQWVLAKCTHFKTVLDLALNHANINIKFSLDKNNKIIGKSITAEITHSFG